MKSSGAPNTDINNPVAPPDTNDGTIAPSTPSFLYTLFTCSLPFEYKFHEIALNIVEDANKGKIPR